MAIIAIVAVDKNLAIGKAGTIPWHYSADMKFFRHQTTGHACVMGFRTWESLNKPLKDRLNIVLSRRRRVEDQAGLIQFTDKSSVLTLAEYLKCDLFVIGGAQVYQAFADQIDRWVVTEVPEPAEGADTFMNADFLCGFTAKGVEVLEGGLKVTTYERYDGNSD
jgi:dihydrofolate reductase